MSPCMGDHNHYAHFINCSTMRNEDGKNKCFKYFYEMEVTTLYRDRCAEYPASKRQFLVNFQNNGVVGLISSNGYIKT